MVPQLIARVDGLPVSLLDRERVWPAANSPARDVRELTTRQRARIERQTACVRECRRESRIGCRRREWHSVTPLPNAPVCTSAVCEGFLGHARG